MKRSEINRLQKEAWPTKGDLASEILKNMAYFFLPYAMENLVGKINPMLKKL